MPNLLLLTIFLYLFFQSFISKIVSEVNWDKYMVIMAFLYISSMINTSTRQKRFKGIQWQSLADDFGILSVDLLWLWSACKETLLVARLIYSTGLHHWVALVQFNCRSVYFLFHLSDIRKLTLLLLLCHLAVSLVVCIVPVSALETK